MKKKFILLLVLILITVLTTLVWYFIPKAIKDPIRNGIVTSFPFLENPSDPTNNIINPSEKGLDTNKPTSDSGVNFNLVKLSNEKIDDFVIYKDFVYFIDRAMGNIFRISISSHPDLYRITNTNTKKGGQYKLGLLDTGIFLVGKNPDGTLVSSIINETDLISTSSVTSLIFRDWPIKAESIQIDNSLNVFVLEPINGYFNLMEINIKSGDEKRVSRTPHREWSIQKTRDWLFLQTRPAGELLSYLYSIGRDGAWSKIIDKKRNLDTLVSPDGSKILVSYNQTSDQILMSVYDIKTKKATPIKARTFAQKCAWTLDSLTVWCAVPRITSFGLNITDWYKGKLITTDDLWSIDSETNYEALEYVVESTTFDVARMKVSDSGEFLIIQDKKDSLWAYNLYNYDSRR